MCLIRDQATIKICPPIADDQCIRRTNQNLSNTTSLQRQDHILFRRSQPHTTQINSKRLDVGHVLVRSNILQCRQGVINVYDTAGLFRPWDLRIQTFAHYGLRRLFKRACRSSSMPTLPPSPPPALWPIGSACCPAASGAASCCPALLRAGADTKFVSRSTPISSKTWLTSSSVSSSSPSPCKDAERSSHRYDQISHALC